MRNKYEAGQVSMFDPDSYCGKVIPVGQTRSVFQFAPKASHARKQTQLFPGVINCSGLSAQEQFTDTLHKPGNEVRIDLVIPNGKLTQVILTNGENFIRVIVLLALMLCVSCLTKSKIRL